MDFGARLPIARRDARLLASPAARGERQRGGSKEDTASHRAHDGSRARMVAVARRFSAEATKCLAIFFRFLGLFREIGLCFLDRLGLGPVDEGGVGEPR